MASSLIRQRHDSVVCAFPQPCHVVYTDFRPTPLQHYAYAPGAKGLFLVGAAKFVRTGVGNMPTWHVAAQQDWCAFCTSCVSSQEA